VEYLPLFHHFKAIYQFPKHILLLVKIVANASLIKRKPTDIFIKWLEHLSSSHRLSKSERLDLS
jgi:hypothetical protein